MKTNIPFTFSLMKMTKEYKKVFINDYQVFDNDQFFCYVRVKEIVDDEDDGLRRYEVFANTENITEEDFSDWKSKNIDRQKAINCAIKVLKNRIEKYKKTINMGNKEIVVNIKSKKAKDFILKEYEHFIRIRKCLEEMK